MAPPSATLNASLGPVSLPLFKLSHCTTATPRGNQLWTHLPHRSDMYAVFDTVRNRGNGGIVLEKKVLKLICGGEQLDLIQLDSLIHQARVDAERCRSQMLSDDLRHVILIVKKPLLALRYQLSDGRIRRIQMNFRPASGCDVAFETLKGTGIFVINKDEPQLAPKSLEHYAQSSQAGGSHSQPRYSQENQPSSNSANYNETPTTAHLPQWRPSSSQAALATSDSQCQGYRRCYTNAYEDAPSSAQPPRIQSRDSLSLDGHSQSQLASSYLKPSSVDNILLGSQPLAQKHEYMHGDIPLSTQQSQSRTGWDLSRSMSHPDDFSRPISYVRDPRLPRYEPDNTHSASFAATGIDHSNSQPTDHGPDTRQLMLPPASRELLPSPKFGNPSSAFGDYGARPVSAPEKLSDSQLMDSLPISQMLPPRRVLPFPERPLSRDTKGMPAPKKPATPEKPRDKQGKSKKSRASAISKPSLIISLPSSSAPVGRSRRAATNNPQADKMPSSSAPTKRLTTGPKELDNAPLSSATSQVDNTSEALERTVSKINKNLTPPSSRDGIEKRPLSALGDSDINERQSRSANCEPSPSLHTNQPGQLPNMPANIQPAEYLEALDAWIRQYHDLPAPTAPKTAKEQLAEYAAKPDEERAKIIDNTILECLQDENFGKLCEDVERNWKRICLEI